MRKARLGSRAVGVDKPRRVSSSLWPSLAPSIIAATVSVIGIWLVHDNATSGQKQQHSLELSKLKIQIISSASTYDFKTAHMLMKHGLQPIDNGASFTAFGTDMKELMASKAPQAPLAGNYFDTSTPTGSMTIEGSAGYVGILRSASLSELQQHVSQFRSAERLKSSNALVDYHQVQPNDVVAALVGGIVPENDKQSYRVNLYIAFTLARISSGWRGTKEQQQAVWNLKGMKYYKDDLTFQRRVDEATANYMR